MALVVMYHTLPPQIVANLINPAACTFFFLSGLISKEGNLKTNLLKRFKQLIVPYYTMASVNILIWLAVKMIVTREELNFVLIDVILNVLTVRTAVGIIPVNIIPLWFVPAVFVMGIYYAILRKLRILPVGIVLGFVSMFFLSGSLPFKLDVALAVLPYFAMGKFAKSFGILTRRVPVMMTIVSSALYAIAATFCDEVYLMEDYFGSSPSLYIFAAVFGIIAISGMAQLLERIEPLKRIFSLFGRRTLFVLGYHIAAGFLVYPIFDFLGDPIEIMERFWYVYWLINMAVVYLLIRLLPEPALTILSGSFLAKRKGNSPEYARGKSRKGKSTRSEYWS
jgi:fucose 4-O-acetylase-like acetyltransferase